MKKPLLIALSLLFSLISFSQKIIYVYPEQVAIGTNQNFNIYGHDTHFYSANTSTIIFTNNTDTIITSSAPSYYTDNISLQNQISFSEYGFYDIYLINNIDDTMKMEKAIYVGKTSIKLLAKPYDISNDQNTNVIITNITPLTGQPYINAILFNVNNDTIKSNSFVVDAENQLHLIFDTSNKHGMYNLLLETSMDSIIYKYNAFNIENSNYIKLDSFTPDTLIAWSTDPILTFYGHNTHFTQDTNSVIMTDLFHSRTHNVTAINDSVLTCQIAIPIACKDALGEPELLVGFLYNSIDSIIGFSFYAHLFGSVNNIEQSNAVRVFPNPVTENKIIIQFDKTPNTSSILNIYSSEGKLIMTKELIKGSTTNLIDLPKLTKGVYFYSISGSMGGKFIVL